MKTLPRCLAGASERLMAAITVEDGYMEGGAVEGKGKPCTGGCVCGSCEMSKVTC